MLVPGQFFILKFDFSRVYRGPNMDMAARSLRINMTEAFQVFYDTYATYLGGGAGKHSNKIDPKDPSISMLRCSKFVDNVISEAC